ncbi:2-alkenal reductase [Bertholletia excelsa]
MEMVNKYITMKAHIEGAPEESAFEMKTEYVSLSLLPGSNDVVVKTLYSFSSSQKAIGFAARISPGEGVGRVVASEHPNFEKGDLVGGLLSWGEYSIVKGAHMINKLNPMVFPLSYHVGILAFSGLTAYGGFFEVCKPRKGEKVFVSAAAGSVGNLVGQYAKLFGCAGTKKKVTLLKQKLGFDEAFNYKEEQDLKATLKRICGYTFYAFSPFSSTGTSLMASTYKAAVANMNTFGRVAVCGVMSEYTDSNKRAAPNMVDVVYKRITIRGFLAADYMNVHADFISSTADHLHNGRIHVLEDISVGLDSIPAAFVGLFRGDNIGKKIVKVTCE